MPPACLQFAESNYCNHGMESQLTHARPSLDPQARGKSRRSGPMKSKDTGKRKQAKQGTTSSNPLATFFSGYPSFDYRPRNGSSAEFYRMSDHFGWNRDDLERKEAHEGFKSALVNHFNAMYGVDASDIRCWQGLCIALDINPLPRTLAEAKKTLQGRHVNIVDLVDKENNGGSVTQFENVMELQKYTVSTGKFFPKQSAHAGGVLKFLLRQILA